MKKFGHLFKPSGFFQTPHASKEKDLKERSPSRVFE
jgi:hypothetical protein